jgi:hypothetical protein
MEEKFVHNNPKDLAKDRFEGLEVKVDEMNHNMNLLMEDL